jgi:hypothetical protein
MRQQQYEQIVQDMSMWDGEPEFFEARFEILLRRLLA